MAANTQPLFTLTPKIGMAQISTANTARDGTGTLGTVYTGTTNGSRVNRIDIVATGTTTAGVVRLFIDDTSNVRLWKEILVPAVTPSTTIEVFSHSLEGYSIPLLVLPNSYILKAGTHNAETFNVIAHIGDY